MRAKLEGAYIQGCDTFFFSVLIYCAEALEPMLHITKTVRFRVGGVNVGGEMIIGAGRGW